MNNSFTLRKELMVQLLSVFSDIFRDTALGGSSVTALALCNPLLVTGTSDIDIFYHSTSCRYVIESLITNLLPEYVPGLEVLYLHMPTADVDSSDYKRLGIRNIIKCGILYRKTLTLELEFVNLLEPGVLSRLPHLQASPLSMAFMVKDFGPDKYKLNLAPELLAVIQNRVVPVQMNKCTENHLPKIQQRATLLGLKVKLIT